MNGFGKATLLKECRAQPAVETCTASFFQIPERLNSRTQLSDLAHFGKQRTVSDLGWNDTLVWSGNLTYRFHFHNLEHVDSGMMINLHMQA